MTSPALPTVSVVVPCRNRAHYLEETIESILSQDYPAIECVVVDGASSDGSVAILERYGDRIRWTSEPDAGPFEAINKGWALASGSIVAWLNADDRWAPGAVRSAVEYLQAHPDVDVVYGHCAGVDRAGRTVWYGRARPWDLERAVVDCDHIIDQPAAFMRRSAVERVGGVQHYWTHDHDLWIRMALAGSRFAAIPVHFADGRIDQGNAGMDPLRILPAKVALVERALANPLLPAHIRRQRRRALSNAHVRGFHYLKPARPRDWLLGARVLARALRADPANAPHALAVLARLSWTAGARRFWRTRTGV